MLLLLYDILIYTLIWYYHNYAIKNMIWYGMWYGMAWYGIYLQKIFSEIHWKIYINLRQFLLPLFFKLWFCKNFIRLFANRSKILAERCKQNKKIYLLDPNPVFTQLWFSLHQNFRISVSKNIPHSVAYV